MPNVNQDTGVVDVGVKELKGKAKRNDGSLRVREAEPEAAMRKTRRIDDDDGPCHRSGFIDEGW